MQNWPLSKIDHFPHLRIHLLCKDQLIWLFTTCSDWLLRDPDLILTWSDVLSDSFDWMDLLLDCCIIWLGSLQFVPISFVSIFTPSACLMQGWMPSLYNSLEACRGTHLFLVLDFIPQYMDHLLIFLLSSDRYYYRLLCINCVEIWSFMMLISG